VLRFVLVPASLRTIATGDGPGVSRPTTFSSNDFRVDLDGVETSRVAAVRGLHMSAAKLPSAPVGTASNRRTLTLALGAFRFP
jgi:hypothetical protein